VTEQGIPEAAPPGYYLRQELEARGWTQAYLAEILGVGFKTINEIITGKRGITAKTAQGLESALGKPATYWMNLQSDYRLHHTGARNRDAVSRRARLYNRVPIKEMIRRGWIEPSEDIGELEQRVLRFLSISSLDAPPSFTAVARRSASLPTVTPELEAWLARARQISRAAPIGQFSRSGLDQALNQLRLLLQAPPEMRNIPRILADAGIRYVVVQPISRTKIDGACFWLDKSSPVIAMSLRFDRIDNIWYTLMHEVAHVVRGDVLSVDSEMDVPAYENRQEQEQLADAFAQEYLIPQSKLDNFIARVHPLYSVQHVRGFAATMHVHPGIVVGQLQHRGEMAWSNLKAMLVPVRSLLTQTALTDGWGASVPTL
jgi:HTH-type transcriptional regulator/antitoxin HigA